MSNRILIVTYCVLAFAGYYESAKILAIFPTPSISHQIVFRTLMSELVRRGHEVVVITTDPEYPRGKAPNNLTEIDVHDISYKLWNEFIELPQGSESDITIQIKVAFQLLVRIFEAQVRSDEVQKLIKSKKKFDLVFVEAITRPALVFSHLYNAPVIQFSSFGGFYNVFEDFGAPIHPLLYPVPIQQRIHDLTFWDKIIEYKFAASAKGIVEDVIEVENIRLKALFGPSTPNVGELKRSVQMLFLNVHPIWDSNRPVPPNVIYLGGLHQKTEKELPLDIKKYLDSSKNGVIYMSFGTNVRPSLLPREKIRIFTKVFSQLKYNVLMKWDNENLPDRPSNVRIFKWVPQSDLLRHPNVKVFITQCGLQSTDESISAGVPLIGVPMLGDQWYNAEKYMIHKIGIKLSIHSLTEVSLMNAISTVIEDDSYRKNIISLRGIIHDQPQTPLQRAVWWTEYVLRRGGAEHLRAAGFGITSRQYYEVELIGTLVLVFLIIVIFLCILIKIARNKYLSKSKMKTQ